MRHRWIAEYNQIRETPLLTSSIMREEDNWVEIQDEMSKALQSMRFDVDESTMQLKLVRDASDTNSLLKKRKGGVAKPASQTQARLNEQPTNVPAVVADRRIP